MSEPSLNLSIEDQNLAEKLVKLKLPAEPMDRDALMYACGFAAGQTAAVPLAAQEPSKTQASQSNDRRWHAKGFMVAAIVTAFLLGGFTRGWFSALTMPRLPAIAQQQKVLAEEILDQATPAVTVTHARTSKTDHGPASRSVIGARRPPDGVLYAGLPQSSLAQFLSNMPTDPSWGDASQSGVRQDSEPDHIFNDHRRVLRVMDSGFSL